MTDRWGCYVHVPWCRVRCPYCAFYVVAGKSPSGARFAEQIVREFSLRRVDYPGRPSTVYLGGGTPSQLAPDTIAVLIAGLDPAPGAEITAEANPEDLTDEWLRGAVDAGVQRVSLGVQSFTRDVARRLGRGHTRPQALSAIGRLAGAPLRSWSVDLIFAVPGQTLSDLDADLDHLIAMDPPHVALYGLTIEPGTAFERARARGSLSEVPDDEWLTMYSHIVQRLGDAGLDRYEISNFARPGHQSAHNTLYWTDAAYLGLGPGAHSYRPDGARWANPEDLAGYLATGPVEPAVEVPTPLQAAADLLISGLRGVGGLSRARITERTGLVVDPDVVTHLVDRGLLVEIGDRIALGPSGFALADGVARRLLDTLEYEVDGASGGPGRLG